MKCVFLDRDGTLIRHIPYLHDPGQVELLPTVVESLALLRKVDCRLFLHTNQSGIGRGYFSRADADACNAEMLRQIGLGADLFDGICMCPELPSGEIVYRKPSPRYALEIIAARSLSASDIVYVGDNISDLETARNVGCAGIGVDTGGHNLAQALLRHGLGQYPVFTTLRAAADSIIPRFSVL